MKKSRLPGKSPLYDVRPTPPNQTRAQGSIEYRGRPGGRIPLARPGPRPLYDVRPTPPNQTRAQGSIEYVIMIAAVLLIVGLTANFLLNNVLTKQTQALGNQSDQVKDFKKQLQQQTSATGPTGTPTPTP